jgi:diacylglycerol kinase family enzyme
VIANGKYLGGQFKVAPQSSISDGYLDVILLKDSGSLMMLGGIVRMKSGNYFEKDNILYFKAKKVHIKSKERSVSISVDGEPIGVLPATFQILHNKLFMRI